MDAAQRTRVEKKQELLIELAELIIEEQVEEGVFLEKSLTQTVLS